MKNLNPYLNSLATDYLYHLGLDTSMDLKSLFGDVRFVCMGGSAGRLKDFAEKVAGMLNITDEVKPVGKTDRFSLYKVGPVISVSHGMGNPSLSILMHEVTKLLHYAGVTDPVYIRIGTCGGIGIKGGAVVLTEEALNPGLEPSFELMVLGESRTYPTGLDRELNEAIIRANPNLEVVTGKTVAANCFYEEEGRVDGALDPGFDEIDKMNFLKKAHDLGVRNMEMEATQFAAFCNRAGIKGAVVCASLLDRLKGDQLTETAEDYARYSENSQHVVFNYIRQELKL